MSEIKQDDILSEFVDFSPHDSIYDNDSISFGRKEHYHLHQHMYHLYQEIEERLHEIDGSIGIHDEIALAKKVAAIIEYLGIDIVDKPACVVAMKKTEQGEQS